MSFFDFNWNIYSGISPVGYSSIDRTSPMETIFTRKTRKRKRTYTPSNYTEDELDELYTTIFNEVATEVPKSKSVNRKILFNDNSSSPASSSPASSSTENIPNQYIPSQELQSLERNINRNLRCSLRIKSIIADKKEQDDYNIIEELENNIGNTSKESVSGDNTNVNITPNTSLNTLITTGKTPLTDLIIQFIKKNPIHKLNNLNINDISSDYNKKLTECFNTANITGIKIRDASCDFIKEEKQMTDIWGKNVTAHAKEHACCYLCNVKIVKRAPPEMEHKIVCPIVFTQFLHYNRLKKLYFTGNNTSIFTLWNEFKHKNKDPLQKLYDLINCSESNKGYPKKNINTNFDTIFSTFEKYINGAISIHNIENFNNEFLFYKSFITFWLMEFAYAHHTCNQGKHYHPYTTSCGINDGTTQIAKRSKSTTDKKVSIENEDAGITQIVKGTKSRKTYLIEHFKHIIECGREVCNNYHFISNATADIDAELATNIFIIKNLRRMYQSTKNKDDNKSKGKTTKKNNKKKKK